MTKLLRTELLRPAMGGISISHPDVTAGTLGCILYIGGKPYIISNSHVISDCGKAQIGDDTLQPGTFDGGDEFNDAIGKLVFFQPFTVAQPNKIDFAMSEANPDMVTDSIMEMSPASQLVEVTPIEAEIGMLAVKSGRTTGLTIGEVTGIDAEVEVGGFPQGTLVFEDLIVVEGRDPLCKGGDSGSAVFTEDGGLLGLLFAGPADPPYDIYFACKIGNIIEALKNGNGTQAASVGDEIEFRPALYPIGADMNWAVPVFGAALTAGAIIGLSIKVFK